MDHKKSNLFSFLLFLFSFNLLSVFLNFIPTLLLQTPDSRLESKISIQLEFSSLMYIVHTKVHTTKIALQSVFPPTKKTDTHKKALVGTKFNVAYFTLLLNVEHPSLAISFLFLEMYNLHLFLFYECVVKSGYLVFGTLCIFLSLFLSLFLPLNGIQIRFSTVQYRE